MVMLTVLMQNFMFNYKILGWGVSWGAAHVHMALLFWGGQNPECPMQRGPIGSEVRQDPCQRGDKCLQYGLAAQ